MKKRALLLSGGVNDAIDHQRYRNDIEAFFRVLTEHWGYDENDVRLHVGRGSPLRFNTASGQNVRRDFDVRRVRVVHDNARRVIVKLNCFEEIPKTSSVSLIQFFRAECVHTVCREVIIRGHDRNGLISRPQSVRDVSRECGFTRSANTLQNDYASHWFVPFTVSL